MGHTINLTVINCFKDSYILMSNQIKYKFQKKLSEKFLKWLSNATC